MYEVNLSLTDSQLEKISDILVVIGEVLFISFVIRFFVGFDKPNILVIILGSILAIVCWVFSVIMVKRVKR